MPSNHFQYFAPRTTRLLWAAACPFFLAMAVFPAFKLVAYENFSSPLAYIGIILPLIFGGSIGLIFLYYSLRHTRLFCEDRTIRRRTSLLYWVRTDQIAFDKIYLVRQPGDVTAIFLSGKPRKIRLATEKDCSRIEQLIEWLRVKSTAKIIDVRDRWKIG